MSKKIKLIIIFFCLLLFAPGRVFASNSFVSIVNPIRGSDFWDSKGQDPQTAVFGELEILKKYHVSATWLIRYDALLDKSLIDKLKNTSDEKGLFLEVTPSWSKDATVSYHQSESWHAAGSAFLTGYEISEREKLIDQAFEKFQETFGEYPKSVGAWWIDAYSLNYMQKKYAITTSLIVADQYSTDNYQIWGQYFSTPYYPSKRNALYPAQRLDEKISLVMVQWAARDPVNSYGNGVSESTYSVQANDYQDFHDLDINYFSKLIDIYTNQPLNNFGQVVMGLENSYSWSQFQKEYANQINVLVNKKNQGKISLVTLADFSLWYRNAFLNLPPEQIIVANDPLGSDSKTVWFMNPYYRAGWFFNRDGSVFRDIRQYLSGTQELCYLKRCDQMNFATTAVRVLDEVSFGHKWVLDPGKINNFKINKSGSNYILTYQNEAGHLRTIEFLPRDISVDGKILSIDTTILQATKKDIEGKRIPNLILGFPKISFWQVAVDILKFILFLIVVCIIPGLVFLRSTKKTNLQKIFLSAVIGLVFLTMTFYITGIFKIKFLIYVYILANIIIFVRFELFKMFYPAKIIRRVNLLIVGLIVAGSIFQVIPTFKSGLQFPYGLGLWGPNTHDGVWHIALANQLLFGIPAQNPIFAGENLKNYHYFYDLMLAVASSLSFISIPDLLFRFFPVFFSISLGIGTYYLMQNLFKNQLATLIALYFVYFSGSFGWIVEFIKQRHLGGESAFWANQAISFNLNPPFAISLIIIIALLQILPFNQKLTKTTFFVSAILIGSLIAFKSYGGVLILLSLFLFGAKRLIWDKDLAFITLFIVGGLISAFLFFSNFTNGQSLLVIAPFWFVNSMIDASDRVGWERISLMRMVGLAQKQWLKFFAAEIMSFIIFLFGNLGLRFFSFGVLLQFKRIIKNKIFLFITIFAASSVLIPTIFIQKGNPWNTIQFIYYYLYVAAIISGLVISWIISKAPISVNLFLIVFVLIFTPINSVVTASGYLPQNPHAYISKPELEALSFLADQPLGTVLTYPYSAKLKNEIAEPWPLFAYDSTAYVAAFSKKAVYMEDEPQNQILLNNYKKRLTVIKDFFLQPNMTSSKFLHENNIKYIYLPKVFNIRLDEGSRLFKNIFDNEEVVIYKVK